MSILMNRNTRKWTEKLRITLSSILCFWMLLCVSTVYAQEIDPIPGWHVNNTQTIEIVPLSEFGIDDNSLTAVVKEPQTNLAEGVNNFSASSADTAINEPILVALTAGLKNDPGLIYNFVRNAIDIDYTYGTKKGPLGTYLDRSGNVQDQAELLVTLLNIAGYNPTFQEVTVDHSGQEIADWLKIDIPTDIVTDINRVQAVLARMINSQIAATPDYSILRMKHLVVKLTVNSKTYYLDPSYRPSKKMMPTVNLATAMGFNKASFISSAKSGQLVNRNALRSSLDQYAGNLINHLQNNHIDKSVDEVLGAWKAKQEYTDQLQDASGYIQQFNQNFGASLPSSLGTTLRIRHLGIDQTFDSRDIYTKRLSIYYPKGTANPAPQLYLDGQLVVTGNSVSRGSSNSIQFNVTHPYSNTSSNQGWEQQLRAGGAFSVVNAWGHIGEAHSQYVNQQLSDMQGQDSQSESLLIQSLRVLGLQWTMNKNQAASFSGRISNTTKFNLHTVGIAGTGDVAGVDGGPYVDFGGSFGGDNTFSLANFVSNGLLSSAFEHGVIEQSQPFTAVSTVKLLDIASRSNLKLYEASSSNWATVKPQLSGYNAGSLASIEAVINRGDRVLLPENGALGENDWQGTGYFHLFNNATQYSAGYIISGGYKGGFSTESGEVEAEALLDFSPQMINTANNSSSVDSVDYVNGSGLYDFVDLTTGSGLNQLTVSRAYNASKTRSGTMGPGWQHNYDLTLVSGSNVARALHGGTALDATASMVAMYVVNEVMQDVDSDLLSSVGLSSGVYQWLMDEYTDNVITVSLPKQTRQYVKLPDGTFSAPKRVRDQLVSLSGNRHRVDMKNGGTVSFDSEGKVSSIVDRNNNSTDFHYAGKLLSEVTNDYGRSVTFSYDSNDRVRQVQDDTGRDVVYLYSGDKLSSFENPNDEVTTYAYDSQQRLNRLYSPLYPSSPEFVKVYDALDRVVSQTNSIGGTSQYYFGTGYRSEIEDALGHSQVMFFDVEGNVVKQVNALGQIVEHTYDGINRRIVTHTPENGMQVLTEYDTQDNPIRITQKTKSGSPLADRVSQFTYTTFNNINTRTNPDNEEVRYSYNASGNLLKTEQDRPEGGVLATTYTYYANGQVKSMTGPDGVTVEYVYDNAANLITETTDKTGQNIVSSYSYWPTGDMRTSTDALGNITTYNSYDNQRRLLKQTSPTGQISEQQYNLNGQLILARQKSDDSTAHPSGWAITSFTYTRDDQVATQIDPEGAVTTFAYNVQGQRTDVTDAEGRKSRTLYDALGRVTHEQKRLNGSFINQSVALYTYTGKVASLTDAKGNATHYSYNGYDELAVTTYPDNTTEHTRYTIDGQVDRFTDRDGAVTTYTYDSLNRLVEQQVGNDERLTYAFNLLGQQTRIRQYVPANSSQAKDIAYQYDALSRVSQVTDANNRTLTYDYDKLDRRTRLTFPDSQYMQYGYDGESRMKQVHYGAQMLASYTYDSLSQLEQVTYANGAQTQVDYSARGDITRLEHLFASSQHLGYQFTYNQVGQQQSKQHVGEASQWVPSASYTESYSSNNLHQYTQIGGDNYGFDSNGNLSSTSGYTYSHNSLNQLTQVTPNGNIGDVFYTYDALGRRDSKDVYGEVTEYLYDGNEVIAEYNASGTLTHRFMYGAGIDNPIALKTNGQTYYYHTDEIGSVVALSNSANVLEEQYSYGPFGQSDAISHIGNPLRYTARRLDSETGRYYYRARYYEPQWGKFLQADPLGYADGMNAYAYVGHDPVNLVDPYGTMATRGGYSSSAGNVDTASSFWADVGNELVNNASQHIGGAFQNAAQGLSDNLGGVVSADTILNLSGGGAVSDGIVAAVQGNVGGVLGAIGGVVVGRYIPAPKSLSGFTGLTRVKPKTSVQGGGGLRKRWKDGKGNIFEWDSRHGTVEKYNKNGRHLGEFDPKTGKQLKLPDKTRKVDP